MAINPEQEILLRKYAEAVTSAPPHLHLTSDRNPEQFWERHIQDSVKLHGLIPPPYRKRPCKVLDVGSGNGIPGIPIAILEPSWAISLLDSDSKKSLFIDTFCKSCELINVTVLLERAESVARGTLRESFDIVFARALGKLPTALELASPFLNAGGVLIVPHGTSWEAELAKSKHAIEVLNLGLVGKDHYDLAGIQFTALLFNKIASTPPKYPRAVGIPKKRPL